MAFAKRIYMKLNIKKLNINKSSIKIATLIMIALCAFSILTINFNHKEQVNKQPIEAAKATETTETTETTEDGNANDPTEDLSETGTAEKPTEETKVETEANPETNTNTNTNSASLGRFTLTAYCSCSKCCGQYALNRPVDEYGNEIVYGSIGVRLIAGVSIAVDPRVIPYGSEVVINGHTYIAHDTGGSIKGNRIDIYFNDHQEALNFGVQYAEVFMVKN